ncbi:hypothetical protein [Streptomyces sp. SA15]|uniref:hypothetical protein n=1 Tax=Streptomyces sp. SA15 TaxID=934019 RepID=UPI00211D0190|nr:hypothetical protein [Streptomyces sp. SA15]
MPLYLWHMVLWHMVPVLVVAAAFYLTGLAPEPRFGSVAWWGLRFPVLPALGMAAGLALVLLSGRWRAGACPPHRPEGPQHALEEAA